MRFFLGTHMANWLALTDVPLFISRRRLARYKTLPVARGPWALDSGGFTELSMFGEWRTSEAVYVRDVSRFQSEVGNLEWVAPMDWMCEPFIVAKTGLTVEEHQRLTIVNFIRLRAELGSLVIPVLQGWTAADYLRHVDQYHDAGVELEWEPTVGVGSVCRRHNTEEVASIFAQLSEVWLSQHMHGFGVKSDGLYRNADRLASADSMAWSANGRRNRIPGHTHSNCANCLPFALRWRERLLEQLGQGRLECAA